MTRRAITRHRSSRAAITTASATAMRSSTNAGAFSVECPDSHGGSALQDLVAVFTDRLGGHCAGFAFRRQHADGESLLFGVRLIGLLPQPRVFLHQHLVLLEQIIDALRSEEHTSEL